MKTEELVEFVNNIKKDYKFGTEYLNKKGIYVVFDRNSLPGLYCKL